MDKAAYEKLVKKHTPKEKAFKNMLITFLFGGFMGVTGNYLVLTFKAAGFNSEEATTIALMFLIGAASLLTALGVFDKLAGIFKMGIIIPITGFAHSVTSAAIEYKKEGMIQGIGSNMLKLAGSVIEYGIFFAYFIAMILYFLGVK